MFKNRKSSFLLILIALSVQSCVVFQNSSVSIDQAVDVGKVKLITTSNKEIIFQNIEKTNIEYFGDLGSHTIHIPTIEVQDIYLLDRKKTNKRAIIGIVVGVTVLSGLWFYAAFAAW